MKVLLDNKRGICFLLCFQLNAVHSSTWQVYTCCASLKGDLSNLVGSRAWRRARYTCTKRQLFHLRSLWSSQYHSLKINKCDFCQHYHWWWKHLINHQVKKKIAPPGNFVRVTDEGREKEVREQHHFVRWRECLQWCYSFDKERPSIVLAQTSTSRLT